MQLRGASNRKRRNRQDSRRKERCFAGPRSTFETRKASPSKPPSPEAGRTLRSGLRWNDRSSPGSSTYAWTTPNGSIQRVRERVAQGGHDVPDADVRRRYTRSLTNAGYVLQL